MELFVLLFVLFMGLAPLAFAAVMVGKRIVARLENPKAARGPCGR
jgi:hypothetical protein